MIQFDECSSFIRTIGGSSSGACVQVRNIPALSAQNLQLVGRIKWCAICNRAGVPGTCSLPVSQFETTSGVRRRNGVFCDGASRVMLLRVSVVVAICIDATWFAVECVSQLQSLTSADLPATDGMVVSASLLVLVLLMDVANFARRFHRSDQQVRAAMQRIRPGDVDFRVALRRSEPLSRLLHECNRLLEWLNRNRPGGVHNGEHVFEIDCDDHDGGA